MPTCCRSGPGVWGTPPRSPGRPGSQSPASGVTGQQGAWAGLRGSNKAGTNRFAVQFSMPGTCATSVAQCASFLASSVKAKRCVSDAPLLMPHSGGGSRQSRRPVPWCTRGSSAASLPKTHTPSRHHHPPGKSSGMRCFLKPSSRMQPGRSCSGSSAYCWMAAQPQARGLLRSSAR